MMMMPAIKDRALDQALSKHTKILVFIGQHGLPAVSTRNLMKHYSYYETFLPGHFNAVFF